MKDNNKGVSTQSGHDKIEVEKTPITIYCHFSFKRPKGTDYGLFAVALYQDFDGKKVIVHKTVKITLWQNHQFITAIQAYEHALATIYSYQGQMRSANIRRVMLVTDNSILAGWIENPTKNKTYAQFMNRAVKVYSAGGPKEIVIGIGLCETRKTEKAYKYCNEKYVIDASEDSVEVNNSVHKLRVKDYKSALDIIRDDISVPETNNINEL